MEYATIKIIPRVKPIEEKPLMDLIFDFLMNEKNIWEETVKKLSKKFELSENYSRKIIEGFSNGNYLISSSYD